MPTLVLEDIGGLPKVERTAPSRRGATDSDQRVATEKKELQDPKRAPRQRLQHYSEPHGRDRRRQRSWKGDHFYCPSAEGSPRAGSMCDW